MPAKKIETWTVLLHFDNQDGARICSTRSNADKPVRNVTHVCPHCDKPWRVEDSRPRTDEEYRFAVEKRGASYCCDATRRDCEGADAKD